MVYLTEKLSMKKQMIFLSRKLMISLLILLFSCSSGSFRTTNQESIENILDLLQGEWVLLQNSKIELVISNDTIFTSYKGYGVDTILFRVSNEIISDTWLKGEVLKGDEGEYFLEKIDMSSGDIEFQYSIISYEKNAFVLNSIDDARLLSYERKSSDSSVLMLNSSIYKNNKYKLLYLDTLDETLGGQVQLLKDDSVITTVPLPILNVEVTNLYLHKIEETNKGFNFHIHFHVNWGDKDYFYQDIFHFEYEKEIFYLTKVEKGSYPAGPEELPLLEPEKIILKEEALRTLRVTPPTRIDRIDELILSRFY